VSGQVKSAGDGVPGHASPHGVRTGFDKRVADLEALLLDSVPASGPDMRLASRTQRGDPPVAGS
jgi:hypothetical protein